MDDSPLPLSATFPPPPPHYALFTPANLALLASLQPPPSSSPSAASKGKQRATAQTDDDEHLVRQLEPPRVDWIEQDGGFEVFGDFYPIPTHVPTVVEMGLPQLTDPDQPPPLALRALLHAYLQTYSALLHALTRPPPPLPTSQEEADAFRPGVREVGRLAEIGVNMIVRVNELRSEQAKATLEGLMQAQIAQRREDTRALRERCASLSSTLAALRAPLPAPAATAEVSAVQSARAALERAVAGLDDVGPAANSAAEGGGVEQRTREQRSRREAEVLGLLDGI